MKIHARAHARGIRTTICPVKGHMMTKKGTIKGLNHQKSIKINEIPEKTIKIIEKHEKTSKNNEKHQNQIKTLVFDGFGLFFFTFCIFFSLFLS